MDVKSSAKAPEKRTTTLGLGRFDGDKVAEPVAGIHERLIVVSR
jgi:hypothetical protein